MNIQTFIIHLERATDRKLRVEDLLAIAPTEATVINAIDGLTLQDADILRVYQRKIFSPVYPFTLSHSEIACFLSHRKAWQALVNSDLDAAFILEDDVLIDESTFKQSWELACENMRPTDYIRFPFQTREKPHITIAKNTSSTLFSPKNTGLGAQAQLIGRAAAITLLKATKKFDRPVDTFIQMTWATSIKPLYVMPSGISETSAIDGGSLIQKKRRLNFKKLHAEIVRPLYRIKLANMARIKRISLL